jgi:hypothetical protein
MAKQQVSPSMGGSLLDMYHHLEGELVEMLLFQYLSGWFRKEVRILGSFSLAGSDTR